MNTEHTATPVSSLHALAFGAGLLMVGFAPLIRGGNRHVALAGLELLALLVLLVLAWRGLRAPPALAGQAPLLPRKVWLLVLAPLWVALVQLLPLPPALWAVLPGHAVFVEAMGLVQASASAWRPVSLVPEATLASVLAGLPMAAAFLLAYLCSARQLNVFLMLWIGLALLQAWVGALQISGMPWLYLGANDGNNRPMGTFANPNHLASFIAMSLPLAVMKFRRLDRPHHRHAVHPAEGAHSLWGVAVFMLLAGLLISWSRGGIASAFLALTLTWVLLPPRNQTPPQRRLWFWGALGAVVLLLATVGFSWIGRFTSGATASDASFRSLLFSTSWQAALDFFPLGSGLGTYAGVYPHYQPDEVLGFAEHAHSDYVQLLMEGGVVFVWLAVLAGWLVWQQSVALHRQSRTGPGLSTASRIKLCCGLGLLALLLHAWVDFNWRIPANAIFGAFLLGAFLRPPRQSLGESTFEADNG